MQLTKSVSLRADLLQEIDQLGPNRSAFVARAVRVYLRHLRHAKDIDIINKNADRLNAEAMDVLAYQRCRRQQ